MKNLNTIITVAAICGILSFNSVVADDGFGKKPPARPFQNVSELVALPEFIPGLGSLYVDPNTLPAGPFLAYDRNETLVSTVYMIPLAQLNNQKDFAQLGATGYDVVETDIVYNAGHPGVSEPHYHIVLWHVPRASAGL